MIQQENAIKINPNGEVYTEIVNHSETYSPKFGLRFCSLISLMDGIIYFRRRNSSGTDGCFKLMQPVVTTPARFESWLIRTVLRTKFEDYIVTDSRYSVDFSCFGPIILNNLFNIVLRENKNTSWLLPLQELILRYKVKKPTQKDKYLGAAQNHYVGNVFFNPGNAIAYHQAAAQILDPAHVPDPEEDLPYDPEA